MDMVHLPDDLARRLGAEAARRGISVEELALEALEARYRIDAPGAGDVATVAEFIGAFDSGDREWAGTDTHVLRAEAAARRQG